MKNKQRICNKRLIIVGSLLLTGMMTTLESTYSMTAPSKKNQQSFQQDFEIPENNSPEHIETLVPNEEAKFIDLPRYLQDVEVLAVNQFRVRDVEGLTEKVVTSFKVKTNNNGCTRPEDFEIKVRNEEVQGTAVVSIQRIQQDFCKGNFPEGTRFTLKTEQIGVNQEIQFVD